MFVRGYYIPIPFDATETRKLSKCQSTNSSHNGSPVYFTPTRDPCGSIKMPHLLDHDATGILTPSARYDNHDAIFVTSALSTVNNNALSLQIINFTDTVYTIGSDEHIADFTVLSPDQIKHVKPIHPGELNFMMHQDTDTMDQYIHELLKVPSTQNEQEEYWFPTPENPGDPTKHTPIQQRIYNELIELQKLEKLNPQANEESRQQFLANFDWTDTTLSEQEKQQIEKILVEFNDIFARHRFDIGTNQHFKIKLTPNDERPAYSQSLPTPIHLKDDITVELALLHKYSIIHNSTIFQIC